MKRIYTNTCFIFMLCILCTRKKIEAMDSYKNSRAKLFVKIYSASNHEEQWQDYATLF